MTRLQLEHIIRAAAMIANDDDIIVAGSQAILGQFPDAPAEVLISREAGVYPMHHPDRADLIDGSMGDGSPFHRHFGYADGVGEDTSVLPQGWRSRLIRVESENTRGARGWCLEVHDLAIAKHVAGREKDIDFTADNSRLAQSSDSRKAPRPDPRRRSPPPAYRATHRRPISNHLARP